MLDNTYYDRKGNPISYEAYILSCRSPDSRRVDYTVGDGWIVSTIHLGLNHAYDDGSPLIFETIVFDEGNNSEFCDRYYTEEEAKYGHKMIVLAMELGIPLNG